MVSARYIRLIAAFLVYAVIDIVWNVSPIALGMYERLHKASGNDEMFDSFGKQPDTWGGPEIIALLAFFALIAFANSHLAIEPAVKEKSVRKAAQNSFLLGCAAYATYIAPIFVAISTWPFALVPKDILIGGVLSLVTSTSITYVTLRRSKS